MRNGVTLEVLRKEVMIEAGLSTSSGASEFTAERINHLIARHERNMALQDDWPTQHFEEEVTVAADGQFADLPEHITFTDINTAHVQFGTEWLPIAHGISPRHRSIYDTTGRATPIQRWEVVQPGSVEFEVWPIGSTAQTILFSGSKTLGEFKDDNDTCVLDGDVLVLRVAAEILGRDKKEDAALKLDTARSLTAAILKRQGATKKGNISQTGRAPVVAPRAGIDYIPPGSGM